MNYYYLNVRILNDKLTGLQRLTLNFIKHSTLPYQLIRPSFKFKSTIGSLWEQFILPLRLKNNRLLFCPANTGPIIYSNKIALIADIAPIEHPEWFSSQFAIWFKMVIPRIIKTSKAIITISNYSKERILEKYGHLNNNVYVVYLGIEKDFKFDETNDNNIITLPRNYYLFVGSIDPRKNINLLIDTWNRKYFEKENLVIVGNYHKNFNAAKITNTNNITVLNNVNDSQLRRIYQNAKCLIYPSLYEGFAFPALEALSLGTPVICSDIKTFRETLGDYVYYVDPHSSEDLEKLIKGVNFNSFKEKTLKIQNEIFEKYSWRKSTKMIEDIITLYNKD